MWDALGYVAIAMGREPMAIANLGLLGPCGHDHGHWAQSHEPAWAHWAMFNNDLGRWAQSHWLILIELKNKPLQFALGE